MRAKIKILHIEDRFHPDYGYQLNNIAAVHHPEFDFYILTSKSFLPWHVNNPEHIFSIRDREFEKKHSVTIRRLSTFFEIESRVWIKSLKKEIDEIDPDVIFVHGVESFTFIRIILSNLKCKKLIFADTHNLLNLTKNRFFYEIFYFFFRKIIVRTINKHKTIVFYTSEENRMMLRDIYGIRDENIRNGQIGTNPMIFKFDAASRNAVRNELNIGADANVIIYSGKLDMYKQPHLILLALHHIESQICEPLHVLFIGSENLDYVKKHFMVTLQNSHIKIHLLKAVKSQTLYKYYSVADIAVFPKYNTLSCLDVQANKLPVIMEDDPTNRLRLQKGGLLYKKNEVKDLARKIYDLISDSDLRSKLRENGYNYILEHYDYRQIVANMESVIESRFDESVNARASDSGAGNYTT